MKINRLSLWESIGSHVTGCLLASLILFSGASASAAEDESSWPYANETKTQRDDRMEWWRQARFGMFIHWGVYAVPAGTYEGKRYEHIGEWIMHDAKIPVARYKEYARQFNPVNYDPDAWVRLAKEAGMKYIVITSKHHDGFALFDSKVTNWDVVDATPYGKDLLAPLAKACRKYKMKLGFYYSQAQDWCHQGGASPSGSWDPAQEGDVNTYVRDLVVPQVREILTNYGDIAVVWWDTPFQINRERADMIQPMISLQPGIITNNRLGGDYPGDTETPEQHIPATGFKDRDWETCMTMNNTWGYKSYDQNWKSTEMLIRNLVDIASKGGNYLLNVGPTDLGEIPQASIERLKEIGQWMKVNGDSIYGTTASPFMKLAWGRCTKKVSKKGATLYLHVFYWPADGELVLPGLKNEVKKAYLLGNHKSLKTRNDEAGVILSLPEKAMDAIDTVIVVKIKGDIDIQEILPKQDAAGTVILPAALSNIHNHFGSNTNVEEKNGKMNIGNWTSSGVWVVWLFQIDRPGRFEVVAEVAVADPETKFELKVDGQTVRASAVSTGGYESFKTISLGQVTVKTAGEHKLEIHPDKNNWHPLNVRSIQLRLLEE